MVSTAGVVLVTSTIFRKTHRRKCHDMPIFRKNGTRTALRASRSPEYGAPRESSALHDQVTGTERNRTNRRSQLMRPRRHALGSGLTALILTVVVGCNSSPGGHAELTPQSSVQALPGGCAGTVLTRGQPPTWAQGGWNGIRSGDPWPVPWALGSGDNAVAFLFATHLVAGGSPRSDGSNNKVLWVVQDAAVSNFVVMGRPRGQSQPVVEVAGGPSIVDPPTPGCWTFELSWTAAAASQRTSTVNLDVLPKGSRPV